MKLASNAIKYCTVSNGMFLGKISCQVLRNLSTWTLSTCKSSYILIIKFFTQFLRYKT